MAEPASAHLEVAVGAFSRLESTPTNGTGVLLRDPNATLQFVPSGEHFDVFGILANLFAIQRVTVFFVAIALLAVGATIYLYTRGAGHRSLVAGSGLVIVIVGLASILDAIAFLLTGGGKAASIGLIASPVMLPTGLLSADRVLPVAFQILC